MAVLLAQARVRAIEMLSRYGSISFFMLLVPLESHDYDTVKGQIVRTMTALSLWQFVPRPPRRRLAPIRRSPDAPDEPGSTETNEQVAGRLPHQNGIESE